jgi:hypothetical protein
MRAKSIVAVCAAVLLVACEPRQQAPTPSPNLREEVAASQGYGSIYLDTHERMATNIARYLARGYVEFARRCERGLARV